MDFPLLAAAVVATAAATTLTARVTKQYFAAAVAGPTVILLLHGWRYFDYTSDDAYISYRYARNLATGVGIVWNPGEHVEGYSNFAWTALLAALHKLGADLIDTGRWLGFGFAVAALAGTYALTRSMLDQNDVHSDPIHEAPVAAHENAGLVATLLLAASGPFALWAFAGLETTMFATLVLAATLLHIREDRGGAQPLSGVVWAFACMTRPDALLLFGVSAVSKAVRCIVRLRDNTPGTPWATTLDEEMQHLVVWTAGFALFFGPYFAWRYFTYDHLFPNTYYAKVGSGLDQYERGLLHFSAFAREYAAWLLALVPVATALASMRRDAALYALALVLAWFAYVVYVGGDSLVRFRFFAPMLPLMYALIAASGAAILRAVRFERAPPRFAREGVLALAGGALLLFTLHASATDVSVRPERQAVFDRAEIGRWLRYNAPSATLIAVIPAGAIPYESDLPTIDMLGINDEHIARRDLDLGTFAAGHEKYDSLYVLDRSPDIIILMDTLSARPWRREDYGVLAFGIIPARIDMLAQPRLWEEYEARSAQVREGVWLNLLVRRDASDLLARTRAP
jgi:hypothetical protein